ncbi:MFS transporter [Agrobacterium vitis]|uniref:MFS transporter n=1 Tax=Agrobacterium vitis TaxID=373 RepID=UPI001F3DFAA6|nr:MFS transporter [Agrobacterium vitis]
MDFSDIHGLIQSSTSIYFSVAAFSQILAGWLSDRKGEKYTVIVVLILFFAASIGVVFSQSANQFFLFRALQGVIAGITVVSRSLLRKNLTIDVAASALAYASLAISCSSIFGPLAGAGISNAFGWISVPILLIIFASGLLTIVGRLNESSATESSHRLPSIMSQIKYIASDTTFVIFSLVAALSSSVFYIYFTTATFLVANHTSISPLEFSIIFALNPVGYFLGNLASGIACENFGWRKVLKSGCLISLASAVTGTLTIHFGVNPLMCFFIQMFFVGIGNGIIISTSSIGMLSGISQSSGMATGLGSGIVNIIGSIVSLFVGTFNYNVEHPEFLNIYILIILTCAAVLTFGFQRNR